jgi:hypothetical protein
MKRVVTGQESFRVVSIDQFDGDKIYAVNHNGHIYKLDTLRIPYSKVWWIFKSLHNSICGSHGYHETAKKAIEAEYPTTVYEFDSVKEFAQWVLDNAEE